jgi:hypothetical protein
VRTLRQLRAASLSVGRRRFPPSRPTADVPLCREATRQLLSHCDSKRGRLAYARLRDLPSTPSSAATFPRLDTANCARSERPWTS